MKQRCWCYLFVAVLLICLLSNLVGLVQLWPNSQCVPIKNDAFNEKRSADEVTIVVKAKHQSIDVVYTWVNGSDPAFQQSLNAQVRYIVIYFDNP